MTSPILKRTQTLSIGILKSTKRQITATYLLTFLKTRGQSFDSHEIQFNVPATYPRFNFTPVDTQIIQPGWKNSYLASNASTGQKIPAIASIGVRGDDEGQRTTLDYSTGSDDEVSFVAGSDMEWRIDSRATELGPGQSKLQVLLIERLVESYMHQLSGDEDATRKCATTKGSSSPSEGSGASHSPSQPTSTSTVSF
jgi:hypothetical protein